MYPRYLLLNLSCVFDIWNGNISRYVVKSNCGSSFRSRLFIHVPKVPTAKSEFGL